MLTLLKDYKGELDVNGTTYPSIDSAISAYNTFSGEICIKLHGNTENGNKRELDGKNSINKSTDTIQYRISVKSYMTKHATPEFDFMAKWNNDKPMPLRTMIGTIEKETRGMVYMKLKGFGERTVTCMCCGKELKNPISRHYGIGPVCMSKVGIIADIEDVDTIRQKLAELTWEGWIIRSSILSQEVIE